ncbi:MAG: hypothetical protein H6741_35755 [Alphaproteobacteria bacterium]|nr:hypothetical protein [Alphaproteobacteria bacterium]
MAQTRSTSPELAALHDAVRRGDELRDLLDTSIERYDARPIAVIGQDYVVPKPKELRRAVAAWTAVVFGSCYVALPFLAEVFGLYPGLLRNLGASALGLAGLALATIVGVSVFKPEVRIPTDVRSTPRDPVIAASLGGFLMWAFLHNTLPWVVPFSWMTGTMLLTFLAFNALEMSLWGAMLSSFTRSRGKAFALGAAFQLGFFALWTMALIILW